MGAWYVVAREEMRGSRREDSAGGGTSQSASPAKVRTLGELEQVQTDVQELDSPILKRADDEGTTAGGEGATALFASSHHLPSSPLAKRSASVPQRVSYSTGALDWPSQTR